VAGTARRGAAVLSLSENSLAALFFVLLPPRSRCSPLGARA
jgi:hypothetical protein